MESDKQGWQTTEKEYKGFQICTKSKKGSGIKSHCIKDGKVLFTQRFSFITPDHLLKRMCDRIDLYLAGKWIPAKKLKNNGRN